MVRTVLLLWAVSLLITGCNVAGSSEKPTTGSSPVTPFQIQAEGTRDAHLLLDVDLQHPAWRDRLALEVWYVRPERIRLEILESTYVNFRNMITAANGERGWTYHPGEQRVDVGPLSRVRPPVIYDIVASALQAWFGEAVGAEEQGVSGYDWVGSGRAAKLSVRGDARDCTVWFDVEEGMPVKIACESALHGSYAVTVREAEYDIGLTDELFDISYLPTEEVNVSIRRLD